ncbi:MAG: adenosine deaminase [Ruminococcaceae bacterium]|nr:adenosine deaminase [Oscillospiraceae bacterium]
MSSEMILKEFPRGADCLIDLHLHLDGSLSADCVRQLGQMQEIDVPDGDVLDRMLSVSEGCRDLNEYLEKFDFPLSLLQTEEAIAYAVQSLEDRLLDEGVMYAEIRFAPQLHTRRGLTQEQVVRAAIYGNSRSPLRASLILCCMRMGDNKAENLESIRLAAKYLGCGVCAADLAGAEALFENARFEEEFSLARQLCLPFTLHAGEASGADSVRTALEMGARRIGHGVRSLEDGEVVKSLVEREILLELCPTSNLNTNMFENLSQYPLRELMAAGVRVSINTDNTAVSRTSIRREWDCVISQFSLTAQEVKKILCDTAESSFANAETVAFMKEKIQNCF